MAIESSKTNVNFRSEKVAVEESLDAKMAHVNYLDRELAIKVEKRQQILTQRRETSQRANCLWEESEGPPQDLH